MAAAVSGLSPVIITVLIPIARNRLKRSGRPPLTMSFRWMTPSALLLGRDDQRRAAGLADPLDRRVDFLGERAADELAGRESAAPLRICSPSMFTPLMRVWAVNGTNSACGQFVNLAAADAILVLGQHDDAAAFGRFIGEAGKLGGVGQFLLGRRPARG